MAAFLLQTHKCCRNYEQRRLEGRRYMKMVGVEVLRQNPLSIAIQLRPFRHQIAVLPYSPQKLSSLSLTCCLAVAPTLESVASVSVSTSNPFVALFHRYGFSDDDIERILHRHPRLINATEKTLKPKLDCLLAFGFSPSEVVTLVSHDPILLNFSLQNRILPNLDLLETLLGSKELVRKAIGRSSRILKLKFETYILPNVELLKSHGIPHNRIVQIVTNYPQVMADKPNDVDKVIKELKELGFNPYLRAFVVGIHAKLTIKQEIWDGKVAMYRSFGWSEENLLAAFRNHPHCMLTTESKISKVMDFYVNKLNWDPIFLSRRPIFVDLSIERRVMPRCAVLNILAEKDLLRGVKSALYRLLLIHNKDFEAKFVHKYTQDIPPILEVYEGRLEFEGDFSALRFWQEKGQQKTIKRPIQIIV